MNVWSDKSDLNRDEFDVLYFVRRDITQFTIPSNIKILIPKLQKFLFLQES